MKQQFLNLGLARVKGSLTAEAFKELLSDKLEEFCVGLEKDVIAVVTDGPSVMKKFGRLLDNVIHQLCYSHGIHLGVTDVLYKFIEMDEEIVVDAELETSGDDDLQGVLTIDGFEVILGENKPALSDLIKPTIKKVRKIIKSFNKSPLKTEMLTKYLAESNEKELVLILDCQTRWNSLVLMCERVLKVKDALKKVLIDLGTADQITTEDFKIIEEIVLCLRPVMLAVEKLCRRDANLITADACLRYVLIQLHKVKRQTGSVMAANLLVSMKKRLKERRGVQSDVLQFLHNRSYKGSLEFPLIDEEVITDKIHQYASWFGLLNSSSEASISQVTEPSDDSGDSNMDLDEFIACQMKTESVEKRKSSSVLVAELNEFNNTGIRGPILDMLYQYLLTIPPCSVEPERAFSAAGYFVTKIRSSLGDETLDLLCLLRAFFKQICSKK